MSAAMVCAEQHGEGPRAHLTTPTKDADRSEHEERAGKEANQYGYAGRVDRGEEVLGPRGHREAGTCASARGRFIHKRRCLRDLQGEPTQLPLRVPNRALERTEGPPT